MERVILHSDANGYYASVECLYDPDIRDKPVAVCGDPEARHGIVLAKNQIAKKYNIKTGEAIWQAREKCPELVAVMPNFSRYVLFSRRMRDIYTDYASKIEAFGLDESWLDISQPGLTIMDGERIANEIRERVKEELGITVSIGVSFNKVFAKLGSDYKKPDAVTLISERNFREIVWALPVYELIYVGPKTAKRLMNARILTIGQLAQADSALLRSMLGKNGIMLKAFAMGLDHSEVMDADATASIKSIGNSSTPPHDIETPEDAKCLIYLLSESVGARLREQGMRAKELSLSVRTTELATFGTQATFTNAVNLTDDIAGMAWRLFTERYMGKLPFRSMGVTCASLVPESTPVQLDVFGKSLASEKAERLERTLDGLRTRFGHQVIRRGIVMFDRKYSAINPKEEQTIHPVAFLRDGEGGVSYGSP